AASTPPLATPLLHVAPSHVLLSFFYMIRPPPRPTLFPYTTLFRSWPASPAAGPASQAGTRLPCQAAAHSEGPPATRAAAPCCGGSEEHTSELQSLTNLVCRLLLEKKNHTHPPPTHHTSPRPLAHPT